MSTNESDAQERTAVNRRLRRGVTECMTVVPMGGDCYSVTSQSGREYAVDAAEGRCTCPDAEYNLADDDRCKHEFRVAVLRRERVIPAAIPAADVDPLLGCAVEGSPIHAGALRDTDAPAQARADGGQPRPEDCDCGDWNAGDDICCWPCYRDGFSSPAVEADAQEADD